MLEGNRNRLNDIADTVPPHAWFGVSSIFHYLGPSFAVMLFPHVGVLGVIWLRMASAAMTLGLVTKPLQTVLSASNNGRWLLFGLGLSFAGMNTSFYFALERLPMSLVAAIEFLGIISLALYGVRTQRNLTALIVAVAGVFILINVQPTFDATGLIWAVINTVFFVLYIILGHRAAQAGVGQGIELISAAIWIAFLICFPFSVQHVVNIVDQPLLILAGIGVGICSSVIPYICDQFAMTRLPRATFALMLSILPAMATVIAAIVLAQIPTVRDLIGVGLVIIGIALHRPAPI